MSRAWRLMLQRRQGGRLLEFSVLRGMMVVWGWRWRAVLSVGGWSIVLAHDV